MTPIPAFPELVEVGFEHLEEIRETLRVFPPEVSSISLGNLFGYRKQTALKATRINGNVCFTGFYKKVRFFSPPVGKNLIVETAVTCLAYLKKTHSADTRRLAYLPLSVAEPLRADKRFKVTPDRDNFDYIYDVKELAELPGDKFHDKKNLVNQFKKKYKYEYRAITADLVRDCLKLEEDWCRARNCLENESAAAESTCIVELLTHFDRLSLFGGALLIDGGIQAFTILQEMDKETAVTHVEKANTKYKGIYQAINNFMAESIADKYLFVNREEDLGEPGLRKAKMSYNPVRFAEKYHAELV